MPELGDLVARLRIDTSSLDEAANKASHFGDTLKGFLGAELIQGGVDKIVDFGKESVDAFEAAQKAQLQLQTAFSKQPQLVHANIDQFEQLADTTSKTTEFSKTQTEAAEAQLAQYGLTAAQMKELVPLVQDYAARTGTDVVSAATTAGKAILGKGRALQSVGINFQNLKDPTKNFAELTQDLRDKVGGFAEKEGATASGRLAILGNQFEDVKVKIGSALIPILTTLADLTLTYVVPAVQQFADWFTKHAAPALQQFGGFARTYVLPVLGEIVGLIGTVLPPILSAFTGLFGNAGNSVKGFAGSSGGFVAQITSAWTAVQSFAQQVWPQVRDTIASVMKDIGKVMDVVIAVWRTVWPSVSKTISDTVRSVWPSVQSIIVNALTIIKATFDIVTTAIQWVWQHFGTEITAVIETAFKLAGDIISTAFKILSDLFQFVADLLTGKWGKLWGDITKLLGDAISGIIKYVGDFISGFVKFFSDLQGKVQTALGDVGKWLLQKGIDLVTGLMNGVQQKVIDFNKWLAALPGQVLSWIGDLAKTLFQKGVDLIQGLIDGIKSKAADVGKSVVGIVNPLGAAVADATHSHSPSRDFMPHGANIGEGIAVGIRGTAGHVRDAMHYVVGAARSTSARLGSGGLGGATLGAAGAASAAAPNITINVNGSNLAPADIARELAWTMKTGGR